MRITASGVFMLTMLCNTQARGQVSVSAMCNIYGTGHAAPRATCTGPGVAAGILPVRVEIPPGIICVTFPGVSGIISYCASNCGPAPAGPDGVPSEFFTLESLDGISGFSSTRGRFLSGVFLSYAEPATPAPAALMFTDFSFVQLSPVVAQQFFIGDGLTGTGSGAVQHFAVPQGAARLYLGFADGSAPCIGYYGDNSGEALVQTLFSGIGDQPVSTTSSEGEAAVFTVSTTGDGPFAFLWQIQDPESGEWTDINDGDNGLADGRSFAAAGAQLPQLTLHPALGQQIFQLPPVSALRCMLSNPCGSAASLPALLTLCGHTGCAADFNLDGGIDGDDVAAFFARWSLGSCEADVNGDGGVDGADVGAFFAFWEAGSC